MEKDCVKCEISSDNEESAISEEKVFLNEQVKVEPDDVHLKIKEETLGTEHVDRDYDSIPPDLKYERPVKQEASLSAFGGPQPTLQSSALQASQPRLPPIAAAAQNQIPKLLRTTTSPSRQGVFVQQFLQNPLSASSTTTVTGCVVNTVSLPQAVGAQSLPQMIGVPIVPQVVGAPSQPVVEATVTAAHATVPQNQFPTATQTATQPNCIQVLPTVTSGQQSVSNITPSVEDVQQCLQQAGVNAGIIVVMKPSGIPTIITSNEQLQLLLQQIQLQQAQPLQAQLQQAQLQQAQLQQAQLQQAQLQQAQLQQAQLQQVQLQQAQLQQAQLQQAQLQQAQLQQAQFQQAQVQLQPQVQFQQAQVQLQQAQVQLQHAQIKGQGQLQPQVEIRPGVQQVKLTLQPSQSVALNTEDIMRPLVQTGTVGSHNDLDVKPPLSVENTFPFDDQRNPTEEAQPMSSRTTLDVPKLVFCSQSPSPSKGIFGSRPEGNEGQIGISLPENNLKVTDNHGRQFRPFIDLGCRQPEGSLPNHVRINAEEKPCHVTRSLTKPAQGNLSKSRRTGKTLTPVCPRPVQRRSIEENRLDVGISDLMEHTPENPFKSRVRPPKFCSWLLEQISIREELFLCSRCERIFSRKKHLRYHQRVHATKNSFICCPCKIIFPLKSLLNIHQLRHTREKLFQCGQCQQSFERIFAFLIHKRIHALEKQLECNQCQLQFTRASALQVHLNNHVNPYSCKHCKESFLIMSGLANHHKEKHSGKDLTFKCGKCGKEFAQEVDFSRHLWTHAPKKPFQCTKCDLQFPTEHGLLNHKLDHSEEKSFECDLCNETCPSKHALEGHKRLHTSKKPFGCDQCKRKFAKNKELEDHRRIHDGALPFECSECTKRFAFKKALTKHQRWHKTRKVKSFKCDQCEQIFQRNCDLLAHKSKIHARKGLSLQCDQCGKRFLWQHDMLCHRVTHTG